MNFRKEKEVTLVIATHGNIPEKFADRVYTITSGRINQ
jgi:ABC-type lipoprotein export system ATPase subunit